VKLIECAFFGRKVAEEDGGPLLLRHCMLCEVAPSLRLRHSFVMIEPD